jgi:hypothetical protein
LANPVVDKFKIDNSVYDVKDAQARADVTKKIDKSTTGNLDQTVSGNMNQTVDGDYKIKAHTFAYRSTQGYRDVFTIPSSSTEPITIGSDAGVFLDGKVRSNMVINQYNDDFDWWPLFDNHGNKHKVAIIRDDADFTTIPSSPVDIRTYQDLKMDGTDDITATINTHTKNEPLFIPAGTYKVSAPLQLKHSLYGAGSSRDPRRGKSDTILKYTANPTAFGSQGVITVSGDDVTGNVVIAHLDIICNGMIGGVVFTTNVYTDNSLYDVSIYGVKSYGVYLQPNNSTLNRYCYMDNVAVWGFSDNTPVERWTGSVAFFWGDKAPDCECNNLTNMVCQVGFDCRTNVFGCNWISYHGIPSGGTGGTDANTWWNSTIACKVTNNDIHVTNFYADTCRTAFVFDGPGKAAAYINNLIYTCNDETATTETGYAALALIGTSPNPQFIVNGGIINRTAKVSTTIQSIGTYPVTNAVCKLDDVYIYTKREYIFGSGAEERGQFICAAGEHRCIDLAITNQMQYTVAGQSTIGDPYQYKEFAIIPVDTNTSQGCIHLTDGTNIDYKIYITKNQTSTSLDISAFDNRALSQSIFSASAGTGKTVTWNIIDNEDKLYYYKDSRSVILYCKRHASTEFTVSLSGFQSGISPVILDRIRNEDGTPMDYPRWDNNNGMTAIKVLRPNIS